MSAYDDIRAAVTAAEQVHEAQQLDLHKAWADRDAAYAQRDAVIQELAVADEDYADLEGDYVALDESFEAYRIAHPAPVVAKTLIGMSAPADVWDQRIAEVGPGIGARRIFADLRSDGLHRLDVVRQAIADGMLPVLSYKVPDVTSAIAGAYDAWAERAATQLDALDADIAVTIWHEPRGDMTGAQFVALHERLIPILGRGKVTVGPIMNGWLLDRTATTVEFGTFTSTKLLGLWDWFGIDSYQSLTNLELSPGDRIPPLVQFLADRGHPDMDILVGEYNAHTAATVTEAGEVFLSTPQVKVACVWNSTGTGTAGATPLSGVRLEAFKGTLADERVIHP